MSWGERSCLYYNGDCPIPNECELGTCNVNCRKYASNGREPDSSLEEMNTIKSNAFLEEMDTMKSNAFDTMKIVDKKQAVKEMAEAVRPKHNCKHCYGTGFIGTNVDTGEKVRCECTRRK